MCNQERPESLGCAKKRSCFVVLRNVDLIIISRRRRMVKYTVPNDENGPGHSCKQQFALWTDYIQWNTICFSNMWINICFSSFKFVFLECWAVLPVDICRLEDVAHRRWSVLETTWHWRWMMEAVDRHEYPHVDVEPLQPVITKAVHLFKLDWNWEILCECIFISAYRSTVAANVSEKAPCYLWYKQ